MLGLHDHESGAGFRAPLKSPADSIVGATSGLCGDVLADGCEYDLAFRIVGVGCDPPGYQDAGAFLGCVFTVKDGNQRGVFCQGCPKIPVA